jgi:hypothetical protein
MFRYRLGGGVVGSLVFWTEYPDDEASGATSQ